MASLRASSLLLCSSVHASKMSQQKRSIKATLHIPKQKPKSSNLSLSNFQAAANGLAEELELSRGGCSSTAFTSSRGINVEDKNGFDVPRDDTTVAIEKLHVILEAVSDRVEMHKNVGEQRDNWNSLLFTSINAMTLAATTMTGINIADSASHNLSSTLLYLAATGLLIIVNKIQPSQLAEEQRNAARLFQQLYNQVQRIITIGNPTDDDAKEAMEKVLALDRAYPLPLLGVMLEKFPSVMEPAVWWPQPQQRRESNKENNKLKNNVASNGWNVNLEEEMRKIIQVIRRNDKAEYVRLGGKALKLNKLLAISGPLLTGVAALGSAFGGSHGSWGPMLGVVAGALATAVNTLEHGGQVGMVFEMYRNNAGFFKEMEESIESNLMKEDVEKRERGELLEMKVALQLGRSLSELRDLAAPSSSSSIQGEHDSTTEEFASKLF